MKLSLTALFAVVFAFAFLSPPQNAQARGIIVYNFGGYAVEKVAELPDTEEFKSSKGHLNLGWAMKEYSLYWAPLWKEDDGEGYVLYVEKGNTIYSNPVSPEQLASLGQITGTTYPAKYSPPFWTKIWGWGIVLLLIIVGIIWNRATAD